MLIGLTCADSAQFRKEIAEQLCLASTSQHMTGHSHNYPRTLCLRVTAGTSAAAHALAALRELRILVLPTKSTLTKTRCTPPGSEVVAADSCGGTCAASAYPSWVAERAEPKSATCSSQEAKRVKTGRAPLHQRSTGAAAACKD